MAPSPRQTPAMSIDHNQNANDHAPTADMPRSASHIRVIAGGTTGHRCLYSHLKGLADATAAIRLTPTFSSTHKKRSRANDAGYDIVGLWGPEEGLKLAL